MSFIDSKCTITYDYQPNSLDITRTLRTGNLTGSSLGGSVTIAVIEIVMG